MDKIGKIVKGTVKGVLGVGTFACGVVINSAAKLATGGFSPSGEGNPVKEAKELSKYWFEEAKKDFDDASKE